MKVLMKLDLQMFPIIPSFETVIIHNVFEQIVFYGFIQCNTKTSSDSRIAEFSLQGYNQIFFQVSVETIGVSNTIGEWPLCNCAYRSKYLNERTLVVLILAKTIYCQVTYSIQRLDSAIISSKSLFTLQTFLLTNVIFIKVLNLFSLFHSE